MRLGMPALAFGAALVGGLSALSLNTYFKEGAEQARISRVESLLDLHKENYRSNLALETESDESACNALVSERNEAKSRLARAYERNENARYEIQEYLVETGRRNDPDFLISHGLAPDPRRTRLNVRRSSFYGMFGDLNREIEATRREVEAEITPCRHLSDYVS